MTRAEFDGGWKTLQGVGWPSSDTRNPEVYFGALCDLSGRQWAKAVAQAIQGSEFFPVPKVLREMAGAVVSLTVEAASAFEQVCGATVHRLLHQETSSCDCTEDRYDVHLIRQRLGDGAADGFLAAGGSGAIARRIEGDPFVLQRFTAAYVDTVSVHPEAAVRALLPPSTKPVPALLPEVSKEAAKAAVEQIAERAGVKPVRETVPHEPCSVVFTPEREAELRAQAAAILAEADKSETPFDPELNDALSGAGGW